MNAESIASQLGPGVELESKVDGFWADVPDLDVRAMARVMNEQGARFVTLTAVPGSGGGVSVIYHWDLDAELVNVATTVIASIATIADILPAADWVERETRDYYGLEFEGRAETPTLMLRDGDEPGLFSRTCDLGTGEDPAKAAREAWDVAEAEGGERQ